MAETKRDANPLVEGAWAGGEAYVVGGGPSLADFDWSLLADRPHIAVVNAAMREVPDAAIWFSEDIRFVERFHAEPWWKTFRGLKLFHALAPEYEAQALACDASIRVIRKHGGDWNRNDKFWSRRFADGLSWSSNSTIGLLNVVDLLGSDPIFLLGVDCKTEKRSKHCDIPKLLGADPLLDLLGADPLPLLGIDRRAEERSNYHDLYPEEWRTGRMQLESFRSDFEHWAAPNLRHRRIVNANLGSGVTCWPKVDRDSFLRTGIPAEARQSGR